MNNESRPSNSEKVKIGEIPVTPMEDFVYDDSGPYGLISFIEKALADRGCSPEQIARYVFCGYNRSVDDRKNPDTVFALTLAEWRGVVDGNSRIINTTPYGYAEQASPNPGDPLAIGCFDTQGLVEENHEYRLRPGSGLNDVLDARIAEFVIQQPRS